MKELFPFGLALKPFYVFMGIITSQIYRTLNIPLRFTNFAADQLYLITEGILVVVAIL
jgi:hypothetical protein